MTKQAKKAEAKRVRQSSDCVLYSFDVRVSIFDMFDAIEGRLLAADVDVAATELESTADEIIDHLGERETEEFLGERVARVAGAPVVANDDVAALVEALSAAVSRSPYDSMLTRDLLRDELPGLVH